VSNCLSDVDSNQLTTPEVTVNEDGQLVILHFKVQLELEDALQLNIYILNELYHRLPDRLYSREVVGPMKSTDLLPVGCCYRLFYNTLSLSSFV